jgi:CIC family chloride channel protein
MTRDLLTLPLWIVLVLPFAKILATSLSIGSGGSGGIFGPGMVIGGMLGAAFWRLGQDILPQMPHSPAPFVIIGMMALFGGIAHAPLAVMLMVAEMTGNLSLLAPAMVAVAISTALVGNHTIYRSQLPGRADSPAHRLRMSFPLLSSLMVRDAMQPLPAAGEAGHSIDATEAITPSTPLPDALEALAESGSSQAIVTEDDHPVGTITVRDAMVTYRRWLASSARRADLVPNASVLVELTLGDRSTLTNMALSETRLPPETLVVSVLRNGETIFPRASTVLAAGDRLSILTTPKNEPAVHAMMA